MTIQIHIKWKVYLTHSPIKTMYPLHLYGSEYAFGHHTFGTFRIFLFISKFSRLTLKTQQLYPMPECPVCVNSSKFTANPLTLKAVLMFHFRDEFSVSRYSSTFILQTKTHQNLIRIMEIFTFPGVCTIFTATTH